MAQHFTPSWFQFGCHISNHWSYFTIILFLKFDINLCHPLIIWQLFQDIAVLIQPSSWHLKTLLSQKNTYYGTIRDVKAVFKAIAQDKKRLWEFLGFEAKKSVLGFMIDINSKCLFLSRATLVHSNHTFPILWGHAKCWLTLDPLNPFIWISQDLCKSVGLRQ